MLSKDTWIIRLIDGVFWLFLIATVLNVIYWIFIPTPTEWPGQFPYDINWEEFWAPFLRHWSLLIDHFPITRFVDVINGVFLTMFVYKIGVDFKEGIKNEGGNGNKKIATSIYVEWAIGALLSGIIFASSRVITTIAYSIRGQESLLSAKSVFYIAIIFTFSFVTYYFLYRLRKKLRIEEGKSEVRHNSETCADELNGDST